MSQLEILSRMLMGATNSLEETIYVLVMERYRSESRQTSLNSRRYHRTHRSRLKILCFMPEISPVMWSLNVSH